MAFDALVLGGGFAGLSCAARLAEAGLSVCVIEKKPRLGGRAFSFLDQDSGDPVDNGQHLFMSCYGETRNFLQRIGTAEKLTFQEELNVSYADSSGRRDSLAAPKALGGPLALAAAAARLKGITLSDKLGILRFGLALRRVSSNGAMAKLDTLTVTQWLNSLGQSELIQKRLFDPLALGILNDDPKIAAATGFAQALRGIFLDSKDGARLGLANVGLSELYAEPARAFIEKRGGRVLTQAKAVSIIESSSGVRGIILENGERLEATETISSLAPWEAARLDLPSSLRGPWEKLKSAPIVSIGLWLDRPVIDVPLLGLIGTEIQWAFNKTRILGLKGPGQYLSLVISGAHGHVGLEPKQLAEIARRDLAACLPDFEKATILRTKVVKEPFATLSPVPGSEALRPLPGRALPGFSWAGDWTRTGLPATIESATLSGHIAARAVLGEKQ